jgi:hypothetical protein
MTLATSLFISYNHKYEYMWPCGGGNNTSTIKLEYWNTFVHVFQSSSTYHPWHPHEVCKAHVRSFRTLIQNCLFFRPFEMLILRKCAKLQVIELMLIVTLFCTVLDVEENLLCTNLTIAYKCLPRNNCFLHSPHSLTLEGNECFPYSPHSSALETDEPILMMHM